MELFKHQKEAIDFILRRGGSGALIHSVGLGKTYTALKIYEALKDKDPYLRLLVVCPLSLINHTWVEHCNKYFTMSTVSLRDEERYPERDVNIINFENIIRKKTLDKVIRLISAPDDKGGWMCVIDESSKMKNHKSLITKTMLSLRDKFNYRLVMSGSPAPNTELEYWAQMEFVEQGTLNRSFFAFRNTFFYLSDQKGTPLYAIPSKAAMMQLFRRGATYKPIKSKREELMTRIGKVSHFAKKEDCLPDLPETIEEIRDVGLSTDERKAYKEMKRHLVIEIEKEEISARNALTKLLKLREISSGFCINEEGESVSLGKSSKLEVLKSLIEEIGDEQAIIWCNFIWEIETIQAMLKDMGKTVANLYGGTVDRDEEIRRFKEKEAQFLVANPLSAGHGLTLVNCHICIYYSINYSNESNIQTAGRIHRPGQVHKCLYIYLLAKDSIDEDIWNVLKNKKALNDVLEGYLR